jgi:hypothetical protein
MMTKVLMLASVAAALSAQQPQPPYLYFRMFTPQGYVTLGPGQPREFPNDKPIALDICVRTSSVEDRFEQLEILAKNQMPGYFENRPPANITLSVRRVGVSGWEQVPFRVNSSGGGKNLTIYFINTAVDILEPKEVRLKRVEQFVELMVSREPVESRSRIFAVPGAKSQFAAFLEEQYINNPPGEYEFIARYTPTTPDNWRGSLVSAPIRIRVVDQGDLLDAMKTKTGR